MSDSEWEQIENVIHANVFNDNNILDFTDNEVRDLLHCYVNYRKDIITEGTELYRLKKEYDQHPTRTLRRSCYHGE